MTKKSNVELVVFLILLVILTVFLGLYFYLQKKSPEPAVTATVESDRNQQTAIETTPIIKSLPSGRQEYLMSHGPNVKGPKPTKVVIDPLTPNQGQTQTVQATITSEPPISQASLILHTDNKRVEYQLRLVSGNDASGVWEATWTMEDSYDHNYYVQFLLSNANGTFKNGLRFRQ